MVAAAPPDSSTSVAAPGAGAAPAVGLDLADDPARLRGFVARLASDDRAEWREAQFRLAMAGPPALDALERSRVARNPALRPRLRALLSLAMLTTVDPAGIRRHRRLNALIAADVARGFALVESLAANPAFDVGERGVSQLLGGNAPPTPVQRLIAGATRLGGFAVPAAVALCRDSRPVARAYGALLLSDLRAVVATDSLERLEADASPIVFRGLESQRDATVGGPAANARAHLSRLRALPLGFEEPLRLMAKLEGGEYGRGDLVDAIRGGTAVMAATSWDAWWEEARPAWRRWWELSGGESASDREEFPTHPH